MFNESLSFMIQLDRLLKEVGSGRLGLDVLTHKGVPKGVSVVGSKKLLYNRSSVDEATDEQACADILKRIMGAKERGGKEELDFKVKISNKKILYVEWHSRQEIVFDNQK